jgi:hypothetical protein
VRALLCYRLYMSGFLSVRNCICCVRSVKFGISDLHIMLLNWHREGGTFAMHVDEGAYTRVSLIFIAELIRVWCLSCLAHWVGVQQCQLADFLNTLISCSSHGVVAAALCSFVT